MVYNKTMFYEQNKQDPRLALTLAIAEDEQRARNEAGLYERSVDIYDDILLQPIPLEVGGVADWKEIPIRENGEPLVPLGAFSNNRDILTSSVYFGEQSNSPYIHEDERLESALATIFVREGVAKRLVHAQQLLPEGYHLLVTDAYRSLEVQAALFTHYYNKLREQHPDWPDEKLRAETTPFVSEPSENPKRPSPHNTGGSVDVTLIVVLPGIETQIKAIDETLSSRIDPESDDGYSLEMFKLALIRLHGRSLNFGTAFDHGGGKSSLNHFEKLEAQLKKEGKALSTEDIEARDSRRILYNVMTSAGFQAYGPEWWHFNAPESQMGAATAGTRQAQYGAASLSDANNYHETMRRMHNEGIVRIQEGIMEGESPKADDPALKADLALVWAALRRVGDPRLTHLEDAEVIAPSANHKAA